MKKMISFILLIALLFTFVGCSGPAPEKIITSFLDHVKKGEYEKAQEFVSERSELSMPILFNSLFPVDFLTQADKRLLTPLQEFTYAIETSSVVSETENTVTITMNIIDFTVVLDNLYRSGLAQASTGIYMDEEELQTGMEKELEKYLLDKDRETQSTTVIITLVKEKKNWKIDLSADLANALTGYAVEAFGSRLT